MPIIYKQNRILFVLRKISDKARFTLTFLFFISTISLWFFFFYYPLLIKNQESSFELDKLLAQQKIFKNTVANLSKFVDQKKQLSLDLKTLLNVQDGKNNLQFVLQSLKKFNLTCKSVDPEKSKNSNYYKKEYYLLKIKGEFKDFIDYFNFIQLSCSSIKFKEFDFEINKKNQIKILAKVRFARFKRNA